MKLTDPVMTRSTESHTIAMGEGLMLPLRCPDCMTPLVEQAESAICSNCERTYPTSTGIYDLYPTEDFYWNEFTQTEMREYLAIGWDRGWEAMVKQITNDDPYLSWLLKSSARIDWLFHALDPERTTSCLDIGSGWGAITENLSYLYDEVWSMDAVSERLEAVQIRLRDRERDNVKLVRALLPTLPFEDNKFDLVVTCGVLEWVPLSTDEPPELTQQRFLSEVYRVLKPGGCAFVGIENRYGAQLMLGIHDHSGLPFTSFLPRSVANFVVRNYYALKNGKHLLSHDNPKTYRTYTYDRTGYERLMQKVGFDAVDIYWTTSYQFPRYSGPFEAEAVHFFLQTTPRKFRRFRTALSAGRTMARLLPNAVLEKMLESFAPNFLIFGFKEFRPDTLQDKLVPMNGENKSWLRVSGSDERAGRVQYFIIDKSKNVPVELYAFPRFPEFSERVRKEYQLLEKFSGIETELMTISGRKIWQSPFIVARELEELKDLWAAIDWLYQWQQSNQIGTSSFSEFQSYLMQVFDVTTSETANPDVWRSAVDKVATKIDQFSFEQIARVPEHRDFSCSNVKFTQNGDLFVVDWDLFQASGWPFFDALYLFLGYFAPGYSEKKFANAVKTEEFKSALRKWASKLDLDPQLLWYLIPYCLARLVTDATKGGLIYRWQAESLISVWLEAEELGWNCIE